MFFAHSQYLFTLILFVSIQLISMYCVTTQTIPIQTHNAPQQTYR